MKSTAKGAVSEALAQMLAVTAMLNRGIHFLFRVDIASQSPSALRLLPLELGRYFVGGTQDETG